MDDSPDPTQTSKPLFRRSGNLSTEAVIGGYGYEDFLIANGFHAASLALVKVLREGGGHAHELVYPIAFGYQQFVELSLKNIIHILQSLVVFEEPATLERTLTTSHDLTALLGFVVAGVDKVDHELAACDNMQLLAARIDEMHEFNPSAFAFRYTRNRDGQRYVRYASFDVAAFSGTMEEVADLIYGLEDRLRNEKIERLNEWADAVDVLVRGNLLQRQKLGAGIYHTGGNVLQMQWTKTGSGRWVTCQLGRDRHIEALFWDEHDRGGEFTKSFDLADTNGVSHDILAFLER